MKTIHDLRAEIHQIEQKLGYVFKKKELLELAFVHRSYINENKEIKEHNERMEFLGDSVLGLLIADALYSSMPDTSEGDLSSLRSRLVEASSCMNYVQELQLETHLLLGRGERMNDGRGRESILADLFEAVIGAIYLDGGLGAARQFIMQKCSKKIAAILETPLKNWKAILQDYCQKKYQRPPDYKLVSETGPDHSKQFVVAVEINAQELGQGQGPSKKEAQQAAAEVALKKLSQIVE